jgi:molybdopterin molybdotransferase
MIFFEEAIDIVMQSAFPLSAERINFLDSAGRILAEDILSDTDMPPFDKSAVDGYACRLQDITNELRVKEFIAAGTFPKKKITENYCSKIMTGAPVPEGADGVLMVEDTQKTGEKTIRFTGVKTAHNICYRAEDVKKEDVVLPKGILIQPQHIAVMAAVGCVNPLVAVQPKIAVISTGNELVEPFQAPAMSQIRNSNAYQLIAQAHKAGFVATYQGIASDDEETTLHLIQQSAENNDVIILTGGISMGDLDFVPQVLEKAGFTILFRSIAVQPGKPSLFATRDTTRCFALPGNPVSSFFQFELLVKPLLYNMMGCTQQPPALYLPMAKIYSRKKSQRKTFLPVEITPEGSVLPVEYHGSAHIAALTKAFGIISIPIGETIVEQGTLVYVRQI